MSNNEFLLPDVGEGLMEADLVAWHVKVGDTVAINDIICDIETAKSVVELPSPFAGTVQAILVAVGETVQVGTPIISIGDSPATAEPAPPGEGWAGSSGADGIDLSNPAASGGGEGETLVGRTKADRGPQRRRRRGSATPRTEAGANTQLQVQGAFFPGGAQSGAVAEAEEEAVPAVAAGHDTATTGQRARAKPKVRRIARDLGLDLAMIRATGPHGTVSEDDVLAAAAAAHPGVVDGALHPAVADGAVTGRVGVGGGRGAAPGAAAARAAGAGVAAVGTAEAGPPAGFTEGEREPVTGVRRAMASAMSASARNVPHVTEWLTVDVSATMALVRDLSGRREFRDVRVTPTLLAVKACLLAMRRTPVVNSYFDASAGEHGEVVQRTGVNFGIAAATPRGLVVPNIVGADRMDLATLAAALDELVAVAKQGRTQPGEMSGGTFTLTNVGVFGVDAGTPIINPGESAILALGAVRRMPWVVGTGKKERLEIRDVTTLALSFDHRHIDGEAGSHFLADVGRILQDPVAGLLM